MSAPTTDPRIVRAADAGMWLFVASLVMLYGGLFSGYVLLRAGSETWITPWRDVAGWWGLPLTAFVWLAGCIGAAWRWPVGLPAGSGRQHATSWALPIAGVAILSVTWLQVSVQLAHAGHAPATSVATASWFVLTGFVAVSAVCGGAAVAWLAWRHRGSAPPAHVARQVQRYWNFLAGCWLSILLGMYVW